MSEAGLRLHVASALPGPANSPRDCEVVMVAGVVPSTSSLRSMYGENAGKRSLSDVTIGIIEFTGIVTGPIRRGDGIIPAVALVDPK